MQRSTQIALVAAPYLGATLIFAAAVQPAFQDSAIRESELVDHRQEYESLKEKVKQKHSLELKKESLKRKIEKLRTAVPSAAELDILILDLEAMSEHAGTDLLGIEEPAGLKDEKKDGLMDSLVKEVGGKIPAKQAGAPAKPGGAEAEAVSADPLGLKHLTHRVYIAGKFENLLTMLKDIEHYQRVIGISELVIATSSDDPDLTRTLAAERGKQLDLNLPVMSFLMHVYYLPEGTDTIDKVDKQAIK